MLQPLNSARVWMALVLSVLLLGVVSTSPAAAAEATTDHYDASARQNDDASNLAPPTVANGRQWSDVERPITDASGPSLASWGELDAPGSIDDAFVYRGVARDHPGYADALDGNAFPRNPAGTTTPEAHNLGSTADSPFTSWTHDPAVAQRFAGTDGVVLRVPTGRPPPGSPWKFEWSPDVWHELEVLIRGPVRGAERWR